MKPSRLTLSTFLALGSLLAACSSAPITPPAITTQSTDLPAGMPRDPDNYIYTADFVDGEMVYSSAPLPKGSYPSSQQVYWAAYLLPEQ